ncbi:MAG: septum formation initiator family protein [Acidimicrobiia bacterium]
MTLLRRPGVLFTTLLFVLLGAAFLTQVVPYRQILDSQRQVSSARAQLASLETENAALQADVEALNTDVEIEKLAREKLGFVKPGEVAFVVLDPPADETEPAPPLTPDQLPESRTWVDQLWDFVTGADLDS